MAGIAPVGLLVDRCEDEGTFMNVSSAKQPAIDHSISFHADRAYWAGHAHRMALPVLRAIASGTLRATMPVEQLSEKDDRRAYTHLEAVGRLLAGIAPWLQSQSDEPQRVELAAMARTAIAVGTDPGSPDRLNFSEGGQPLVDVAFLAQAILRAPNLLWRSLDSSTQQNLIAAMKSSRRIKPAPCNWLLFSAMVEAFLAMAGEEWDAMRIDYAIQQHEQWYKGDGAYGDGHNFHWDYYNSFVIHPMLLDVLAEVSKHRTDWNGLADHIGRRAQRYAIVQERLIAPDGSFPPIGRSLAYRGGAFHLLAQVALLHRLPDELPPSQVRAALTSVLRRTLDVAETYDEAGWLRIGLCGHQPSIGERYISTGSLYLASVLFLPLGLPPDDPFWAAAAVPYTAQRVWDGHDVVPDHAMREQRTLG